MSGRDPLDAILGPDGALSRAVPGYEHRPQQIALARQVMAALVERRTLIAEAGTGTGKTLAYLVPALLAGRRVVVSTATKNLQEQVFFKDVPLLEQVVGHPVRAAYMKGRANYLCRTRFQAFAERPRFETREEARLWPTLEAWARSTETGDRGELSLPETFATWRELSTTSETCLGQRCPAYEDCFVTRMRRKAVEADVVVVNHHLFFADLSLRTRTEEVQGVEVIPRYEAVIFDEAHALEEIATEHFGVAVSSYRFEELCADATAAATKAPSEAASLARTVARVQGRAGVLVSAVETALGLPQGGRGARDAQVRLVPGQLERCAVELAELQASLDELRGAAAEHDDVPELAAIARRAFTLGAELSFVTEPSDDRAHVHFVERRGRGLFLKAAPIEIGEELAARLYRTVDTAIFTSATLALGRSFSYLRARLGLPAPGEPGPTEVSELQVGSPFDFARQAALYLPTHLPEPQDPVFVEHVAEELARLVEVTEGRAFALFTSVRNMTRAHELLRDRLPYRVLLQGELPKRELLERFREKPSVLFATASFWEGVDVPGDALSLVAIDKLPFASPTDPVVGARIDALRARGDDPFSAYQVPEAAIALRQGFGRLIRTARDRGIVAVLDRRIVQKGYGRRFLAALPACPRLSRLDQVEAWWSGPEPAAPADAAG